MVARVLKARLPITGILVSAYFATLLTTLDFAFAGACCGGSASATGLILGDEKTLVGLDFDTKWIATDVSAEGIWRSRSETELHRTLRLQYTSLLSDRWQFGMQPNFVSRTRSGESESLMGDTTGFFGYEALTDWDYHPYRPRGTAYLAVSIPTGRSVYKSSSRNLLDSSGKGYATIGTGVVLNKVLANWTILFANEIHHGIPSSTLTPSWGYNASFSLSYELRSFSTGSSVQVSLGHTYQNAFHIRQTEALEDITALQVTTFSTGASYSMVNDLTGDDPVIFQLTYSDQSLFGQPLNTPLGKSLILGVRKPFLR